MFRAGYEQVIYSQVHIIISAPDNSVLLRSSGYETSRWDGVISFHLNKNKKECEDAIIASREKITDVLGNRIKLIYERIGSYNGGDCGPYGGCGWSDIVYKARLVSPAVLQLPINKPLMFMSFKDIIKEVEGRDKLFNFTTREIFKKIKDEEKYFV